MIPVPEHILQCFGQFSCVKAVYEGSLQKLVPYWAQFTLSVQDEVDPGPSKVMIKTVWLHTGKQWVNMYIDEQCGSLEDEKSYRLMRKCMCIQMKRHRDTTKSNKSNFFLSLYKDCLMLCNWWFWRKKMNTYDPYLLNTNCNILDIAPLQKQHNKSLFKLPFQMKHNLICPWRSLLRM